jgi:hypothetical protein
MLHLLHDILSRAACITAGDEVTVKAGVEPTSLLIKN